MRHKFLLLLILLVGASLRLIGLNNQSPPGLEHDEVAHWLINQKILAGDHAVYYTDAYGHEAGFHYLQTAVGLALGDNALSLRLPAAFCGLLTVAITYALTRRLFGRDVALTSAAFASVLFWPVFFSRLGLRAIALPVCSGLSAYCWWGGWQSLSARRQAMGLAWAGFWAGLSLYTYLAARAVPIFYALFIGYLALFYWQELRQRWRGVALFVALASLLAVPLVWYLVSHPGAEFRVAEVDAPLRALRDGDFGPVLHNAWQIVGMFGWSGDPLWRQNVAHWPVFEPLLALCFYAGLAGFLVRWRQMKEAFCLLWLATSVIPSVVTIDAPSSIRMINALPLFLAFPALFIHKFSDLSTVLPKLSTGRLSGLLGGLWIVYVAATAVMLFSIWPANTEVQFVWQEALTAAAGYLDTSPDTTPVALAGWSPDTMDEPTIHLSLHRQDLSLRYFGTVYPQITTLILPAGASSRLIRPTILPFAEPLETLLAGWQAGPHPHGSFTVYPLTAVPPLPDNANALLAGEIRWRGFQMSEACQAHFTTACDVLTFWQVTAPASGSRRFFVHALAGDGRLLAQHDGLDAPALFWQSGDILIQLHHLSATDEPIEQLRLGLYNPGTCPNCQRLLTADGADSLILWQAHP